MEIERKFLIEKMPDLSTLKPIHYERYFIRSDESVQERIQRKGEKCEIEVKTVVPGAGNFLMHKKEKRSLTEEQFEILKQGKEDRGIVRDSYQVSINPNISIKVYHGKFELLVRAEVEFESEEAASSYIPESWMGKEITNFSLGMDSKLIEMSAQDFEVMLKKFQTI